PSERKRHRRNIADILVRELPDDDSKALELADHLLHVANCLKEYQWLERAGEIYASAFITDKAIACFSKVLTQLLNETGDNEDWLFIKSAIEHSNIFAARSDMVMSLRFLREARERAKRLQKRPYELILEMHIAKYERLSSEFNDGLKRFEYAVSEARNISDPELATATALFSTYFLFWRGRFHEVVEMYEQSVPDVEKHPVGHFPIIAGLMVGHCYTMIGQFTQGLGMLDAIREYCVTKGDKYLSAHSAWVIAMAMLSVNRFDDCLHYLELSLREAVESSNEWVEVVSTLIFSLVHLQSGNKKESLHYLRRFYKKGEMHKMNMLIYPYLAEICWAMETGELSRMPAFSLENEVNRMLNLKSNFMRGIAYRYQALLGKMKGMPGDKVVRLLNLSAEWLEKSGFKLECAKTQLELARHYISTGKEKKAELILRQASSVFSSMNVDIPDDLRAFAGSPDLEGSTLDEMLKIVNDMTAKEDNGKIIQQIVATANRLIGAERGALLLVDNEAPYEKLSLRASKNLTIEQIYHMNFAGPRTIIEEVIQSGDAKIFDGRREPAVSPDSSDIMRSCICVPLILREEIIGALYHENRLLVNVFKESDLKLLKYFAGLAVLSLENDHVNEESDSSAHDQQRAVHPDDKSLPKQGDNGVIGTSSPMRQIQSQIQLVAQTDSAVLILGETGVGKNLIAAAIHGQSARKNKPFITVQCSALTETLITSELFGHEKGAFTGATDKRIGRFELANSGTLFLDEIGDLSLEVQARLLRVLQSKEFERVGGGKDILTSDFRLIAATNRNLEKEVKEKRFREDLYYRINVFPIYIPPLRERREDIPLLVQQFFAYFCSRHGKCFDKISRETLEKLSRYEWPGNVRELENIIQRSVISSLEPRFQLCSLGQVNSPPDVVSFKSLEENERHHILQALERSGWKIYGSGAAAEALKINPSTLASRMKKLGISKKRAIVQSRHERDGF
ncbi:MAG TPA: sigma 54-interacting transcriptional regulator, partial [Syntrophorhabdaceae bacterium]|nr:sigma 54-interacting transcriptional regulator [Syntrophorhabdaceae bacterium]